MGLFILFTCNIVSKTNACRTTICDATQNSCNQVKKKLAATSKNIGEKKPCENLQQSILYIVNKNSFNLQMNFEIPHGKTCSSSNMTILFYKIYHQCRVVYNVLWFLCLENYILHPFDAVSNNIQALRESLEWVLVVRSLKRSVMYVDSLYQDNM